MDEYVIVIETGYKLASAAHRVIYTEPMARAEATRLFLDLMAGQREDLLPGRLDSTILEVSPTEFLQVHQAMGGSVVMDRVTLTRRLH
ncbi:MULTISPECIES: hypothetical protein [unclassified Arthrobacter]|uniref:hypothetical protein n=1 Tax=unclassified Arthrobacter TaxID=235627 RepID=UPI001E3C326E|nr:MULTISPECIES: hypothetical protein [unclassified Arthrobacter]MCC9144091.1 hypothetical protein [Arthrobacter sp. zg-Y919]MDK1275316.1 hypothetical protein [Arthrobacter sp. zg.Y919]MDM7990950.1 hypothetical protein [Arthrobacter sp. zg-Y877]WIB03292.1 hypothetical protein QNO10_00910 [Arthrobacter sp. zg-Y919]